MGRHSTYTPELHAEICERLSKGEPLAVICRDEHMPAVRTVSGWKDAHPVFAADFARARDEGFDAIAAESLEIVDTEPEYTNTEHGSKVDPGYVAWQKNRAEQRLKLLAKWDPRRYGDRLHTEHSGEVTVKGVAERMRQRRGGAGPASVADLV